MPIHKLTNLDYANILQFYKKKIPTSNRILKLHAEQLLGDKLCRCIKKLGPTNEARSIGICTKTVINNKGYARGKFSCKKKQHVTLTKPNNRKTLKRSKRFNN
jgi:hypothetical protein